MTNQKIDAMMKEIFSEAACRAGVRPKLEKLADDQVREMHRQCGIEDQPTMGELRGKVFDLQFRLAQQERMNLDHEKDYMAVWQLIKQPNETVVEAVQRTVNERAEWRECAGRLAESLEGNALEPLWKALEQFHKLNKEAK